jgi:hypothetical protein
MGSSFHHIGQELLSLVRSITGPNVIASGEVLIRLLAVELVGRGSGEVLLRLLAKGLVGRGAAASAIGPDVDAWATLATVEGADG